MMDTLRQTRWLRLRATMMASPWLLSLLLAGCAVHSIERFSASDTEADRQARVVAAVRELGRDGDWVVIRGYHASDNLVSSLTNMPFSHAAVLDADRDEVIEAESPRVRWVSSTWRAVLLRVREGTPPPSWRITRIRSGAGWWSVWRDRGGT